MPSGQRRRRTVSKHLASSMSDCMCIMAPVSPIGRDGTSTRYKASDPQDKERCQLPGIRIEPYGFTSNGARRYYFSLSPEAVERAERILTSYDARALTTRPNLTGMEKRRQL